MKKVAFIIFFKLQKMQTVLLPTMQGYKLSHLPRIQIMKTLLITRRKLYLSPCRNVYEGMVLRCPIHM